MRCNWKCIKPRPHSALQHCGVCHQTFSGTSAGDMHRIPARFRIDEKGRRVREGWQNRCLNEKEMLAIGMQFDPKLKVWRGPRGSEEPEHWGN